MYASDPTFTLSQRLVIDYYVYCRDQFQVVTFMSSAEASVLRSLFYNVLQISDKMRVSCMNGSYENVQQFPSVHLARCSPFCIFS